MSFPSLPLNLTARDWPEDFGQENGQYVNECLNCKKTFIGHKGRTICKECGRVKGWAVPAEPAARWQPALITSGPLLTIMIVIAFFLGVQIVWLSSIARDIGELGKRLDRTVAGERIAPNANLLDPKPVAPEPKPLIAFTDGKVQAPVLIVMDTGAVIKAKELPMQDYARHVWRDFDLVQKDKLRDGRYILVPFPSFGMEVDVLSRGIRLLPEGRAPADLKRFWDEIAAEGKQLTRARPAPKAGTIPKKP